MRALIVIPRPPHRPELSCPEIAAAVRLYTTARNRKAQAAALFVLATLKAVYRQGFRDGEVRL